MGALEYTPATKLKGLNTSEKIEIASLVSIAQEILDSRKAFSVTLSHPGAEELLRRLAFNIVARNHDDHSKNFTFILPGGADTPILQKKN